MPLTDPIGPPSASQAGSIDKSILSGVGSIRPARDSRERPHVHLHKTGPKAVEGVTLRRYTWTTFAAKGGGYHRRVRTHEAVALLNFIV